ncbi:MAG TPA: glycine--tRNA ligase [Candidatus Paceibacterota bacterium]|nr:glycine--tRNA ligase [Candidatus Paceibacterota bacterium]
MEGLMEKIVSLAKRRGFVFPGSEIYGGLAGTYDYGPLGVALKNNIKALWWKQFVTDRTDVYGVDTAILMNQKIWQASGHVGGFSDPMVECANCKSRFRADQIDMASCPVCGTKASFGPARQFNMMFKTTVGAVENDESISYLRPETAQGMFVNVKNILDTFHPKLPFGIAQIGKAFRNEIAPRDFLFRVREFEQMELEFFVRPDEWEKWFDYFKDQQMRFLSTIGITDGLHTIEVSAQDRAHYSSRSVDVEFDFPFGQKELLGLAYRSDYDLNKHAEHSGVDLSYYDEESGERFVPHCIEPTFGVDRLVLALLTASYHEEGTGDNTRVFLAFPASVAPIKMCVSPLLKNKPELVAKAQEVFLTLKKRFGAVAWDDNGNIGKRYRRQDEIGTPFCIVVDFDTLGETPEHADTVTVRDRDSGAQERIVISDLERYFSEKLHL